MAPTGGYFNGRGNEVLQGGFEGELKFNFNQMMNHDSLINF